MRWWQISLLIAAAFLFTLFLTLFGSAASQYSDFKTAKQQNKETHIIGKWVDKQKAFYDPEKDQFFFYVQDTTGYKQLVRYDDPKPPNLELATKVVLIGKYEGDTFVASRILQKCPSKYKEQSTQPQ